MIIAILTGLVIGSIPTADLLARRRSIDLRQGGSGNPGTANALRIGGKGLAASVLLLDLLKGAGAATLGWRLAGEAGAVAAAVAAIVGQVRNPWYRGRGGKGLGVAGGTMLVVFPAGILAVAIVIGLGTRLWRAAIGSLLGLGTLLAVAVLWADRDLAMGWGITPDDLIVWYALGVTTVVAPKFLNGLRSRTR